MFGDLPCTFARQAGVVAVDFFEPWPQRTVIGMPDEVQADVEPILHALEDLGQ